MPRTQYSLALFLTLLVVAGALAGCRREAAPPAGSPSPEASPTALPASPPAPSPTAAVATESPPPTVTPPPSPPPVTPPPTPAGTPSDFTDVAWSPQAAAEFSVVDTISDTASGAVHVAVGATDDGELGYAALWYSADGAGWQRAELLDAELATLEAVTNGPAGMVAVGFWYGGEEVEPVIWRSGDGVAWQRVGGPLGHGQMSAVAAGPSSYLALGSDPDAGNVALAWTSADGAAWSRATPAAGIEADATINGMAWLGDAFLAYGASAGERAAMWLSTDGLAWQAVDLPSQPSSTIHDLAVGPARIVAVGGDYQRQPPSALFWSSAEGRSWEPFDGERLVGEAFTVTPLGAGFVAAGARDEARLVFSATVWNSADGLAWERQPDDPSFTMARITELLTGAGGVIALGERAIGDSPEEVEPTIWLGTPR